MEPYNVLPASLEFARNAAGALAWTASVRKFRPRQGELPFCRILRCVL